MTNQTPSTQYGLKRIFKIGCMLMPLIAVAIFFLAVYPTLRPYFSDELDWGETQIYQPGDDPSWPLFYPVSYTYLALMKYDAKEYLDDSGNSQTVPQRLVFQTPDEHLSKDPNGTIKFGTGLVSIPNDDFTTNLLASELQACFQQLCDEYSTGSQSFSKAEVHLAMIPQQNGDMLYVMAKLMKSYAFRSVWTVDAHGNPTPVAFNFTSDRYGYRYRKDFTRQEILFKDLYLPPKHGILPTP